MCCIWFCETYVPSVIRSASITKKKKNGKSSLSNKAVDNYGRLVKMDGGKYAVCQHVFGPQESI